MKNAFLILLVFSIMSSCKKEQKENVNRLTKNEVAEVAIKGENETMKETITFPSKDSLVITADVYKIEDKPVTMLLCHQAGFSRGEYRDTALVLNKLGYSVIAIDQRSGEVANAIINETAKRAKEKNLPANYLNARQDIEAAIDYIYKSNGNKQIVLVGSSYSATLALLIANEDERVKAVAAFSPGEYFDGVDVQQSIKDLIKPVFVTASLSETEALTTLVSKMKSDNLGHYKPAEKGIHGSRSLWESTVGTKGYWKAFTAFLNDI